MNMIINDHFDLMIKHITLPLSRFLDKFFGTFLFNQGKGFYIFSDTNPNLRSFFGNFEFF